MKAVIDVVRVVKIDKLDADKDVTWAWYEGGVEIFMKPHLEVFKPKVGDYIVVAESGYGDTIVSVSSENPIVDGLEEAYIGF